MSTDSLLDDLLLGISSLVNPDYHKLNTNNLRLLHACLCAYAKHQYDIPHMDWDELGSILHSAICKEIGDEVFTKWAFLMTT